MNLSRVPFVFSISALVLVSLSACDQIDIVDGRLPASVSKHAVAPYLGNYFAKNTSEGLEVTFSENDQVQLKLRKVEGIPSVCEGTKATLVAISGKQNGDQYRVEQAEFLPDSKDCGDALLSKTIRLEYLGPEKMGRIRLSYAKDTTNYYSCPSMAWDGDYEVAVLDCDWVKGEKRESAELTQLQALLF